MPKIEQTCAASRVIPVPRFNPFLSEENTNGVSLDSDCICELEKQNET